MLCFIQTLLEEHKNLNLLCTPSWLLVKHIRDKSGNIVRTVGYYADILSHLEASLNFVIEHTASKEGWGIMTQNGTWNGLMGKLVRRRIDISPNFGLSLQRQDAIDFCWPTYTKKFTLITSRPTKPRIDVWAYYEIFPPSAWAVIPGDDIKFDP